MDQPMNFKRADGWLFFRLWYWTLLVCCAATLGCSGQTPVAPSETLLRIDWVGSRQLQSDTNAATPFRVLGLPESVRLRNQTLMRLSCAPWQLADREVDTEGAVLLRPLLDDLVTAESRFEVVGSSNQALACGVAVRLDAERSALWRTNLARVLEAWSGFTSNVLPEPAAGWVFRR